VDTLGLPLKTHENDDYYFSQDITGSKHFGIWPLTKAAEACFGTSEWPSDWPIPHVSFEFEVADKQSVASAAKELQSRGYALLHDVHTEPWGQTIVRLQSSEGAIVGISHAPSMHESKKFG
jgi:hypothetical protein